MRIPVKTFKQIREDIAIYISQSEENRVLFEPLLKSLNSNFYEEQINYKSKPLVFGKRYIDDAFTCNHFTCAATLTPQEKLFGNKCQMHNIDNCPVVGRKLKT